MALAKLNDLFLTLADQHAIEERGKGLGIIHGRTAADDDGVILAAIGGIKRNTGQIKALEVIGACHLVRNMESHNVEGRDGRRSFERQQRNMGLTHGISHIHPGDVAALTGQALSLVEVAVEDRNALVGQTDLVHVRVNQNAAMFSLWLVERSPLMIDVARWFFNARKQGLKLGKSILVDNLHVSKPY